MGILDYFEKHPFLDRLLAFIIGAICRFNRLMFSGHNQENDKVIIVSLHRLGDTVFTIPAVKALYKIHGNKITIVCFADAAEIYKLAFSDIEYLILQKNDFTHGGRIASPEARNKIAVLKPNTIYDITGAIFSVTLLSGIKYFKLYGVTTNYFKNFYTKYVIQRTTPHLIDLYFDIVSLVDPSADVKDYREFETKPVTGGVILIHPFAGWKAKEWNIEKVTALLLELDKEYDTALICASGQLDKSSLDFISENRLKLIETSSIGDLIENIKKCSLFVGSDSGPLYIAALLGKPTFCIYSSTNPKFSFQFGPNYRYVVKQLECSPLPDKQYCRANGGVWGCPSFECMNRLEYDEVKEKIKLFIKELKIEQKIT